MSVLFVLLVLLATLPGCAHYKIEVGDARLTLTYVLQDRNIKNITYDPNTHTFTMEGFGSETLQVVETILDKLKIGGLP